MAVGAGGRGLSQVDQSLLRSPGQLAVDLGPLSMLAGSGGGRPGRDGEERDECDGCRTHQATNAGRVNEEAFGMIWAGVHAQPLLQQRAVDAAEVGGVPQVVVLVEHRESGELADHLALRLRSDQEAGAGRAVVGAGSVLLGPAAELAPHVHEHAVLDAARLEVALERAQAVPDLEQVARQAVELVRVGVVAARLDRHHLQRQPAVDHRRQRAQPARRSRRSGRSRRRAS